MQAVFELPTLINIFLDCMIKSVKPSGRGGKRLGAGRPPRWHTRCGFKSIRVPISLAGEVMEVARYLDGQQCFRNFHSFEDEESPDFDDRKAMDFNYLHYCAEVLGIKNRQLQWEVESLKAQLKSIRKQRFKVL